MSDLHTVLIGVPDEKMTSPFAEWSTNKIGGKPDVMVKLYQPACSNCGADQSLVIQVYCPLEASTFHRTIYVFCCRNKDCWTTSNGWTALRMQMQESHNLASLKTAEVPNVSKSQFDWNCDDADDWGDTTDEEPGTSNLSTGAEKAQLAESFQQLSVNQQTPPQTEVLYQDKNSESYFQPYYVNVCDEAEFFTPASDNDIHIKTLIEKYDASEGNLNADGNFSGELKVASSEPYEKVDAKDVVSRKFMKKVNLCQNQIIRYSHGESPLLLSDAEPHWKSFSCDQCNSTSCFEFQLMPGLIPYLCTPQKPRDCVEFGTVLVYTCARSCWDDVTTSPVREHVIYLPDPDLKFFKTQKTEK